MIARSNRPQWSTRLTALGAVALTIVLGGCSPSYHVVRDDEFSSNLLLLETTWPGDDPEDIMTEGQLAVYEELGRPDFIRMLFNRRGDVMVHTRAQHELFRRGNEFEDIDKSWIYRARDLEVCFFTGDVVERRPLTAKIATLVEYGDPHEVKDFGNGREKWFYYDQGRGFNFVNDQLVGEPDRFPSTPYLRTK